ncbi:hypothetical protein NDI52_32830 [Leptolyngbya sp. PL-A3]|uniref:hypothetical protein n=1 Tax=Leptolyngbya sp. FACHB-8 TaxID=2692814 RepID=UPI001A7F061B|nr:hypothetical protein [Leptolyngbya sp. FACHB-8]
MLDLRDCIVLEGPELIPHRCSRFVVEGDVVQRMDLQEPCGAIAHGSLVIMPGMYNSHTHMGDSCLPDGATDTGGYLKVGLPADLVVLNFHQPHLRASQHILASILTRVTPADVLLTLRQGTVLYQAEEFGMN